VRGRHPDVGDDEIGQVDRDLSFKALGISGDGHHVETVAVQEVPQAFAQEDFVFAEDHAHGRSTISRVP
jgi:hypothetical protein